MTGEAYPFLRHEFLYGLEKTDCTTAETGWQPCHLLLRDDRQPVAALYITGGRSTARDPAADVLVGGTVKPGPLAALRPRCPS